MNPTPRVRIAIQKKGRLSERSVELLRRCGVDFDVRTDQLLFPSSSFPIDVMLVRDDDIPLYVYEGICELGIVGQNVLEETLAARAVNVAENVRTLTALGFGKCRLAIAVPKGDRYDGAKTLDGKRLATSYPQLLGRYLKSKGVTASCVEMNGSVEIAPALQLADGICDLVQTGSTLVANGLREVETIFESQAVLVQTQRPLEPEKQQLVRRLEQRVVGVTRAVGAKYVMMNAPRSALEAIRKIMPGMESPSVIPLGDDGQKVAVHTVARETDFWVLVEQLKAVGASSILIAPVEKIID
ncbi:MAG: ATP phosphoribosyltransferase [Myxococcaceae bacterium]|nr:ATP phosphoribosyltransferase [Myxococcaceae bacterium]